MGTLPQDGNMSNCSYFDTCGLDCSADRAGRLCILHSGDLDKDKKTFSTALNIHIENHGNQFFGFVFPDKVSFEGKAFNEADFRNTTFAESADFSRVAILSDVTFEKATFRKAVTFSGAAIHHADYSRVTFQSEVTFKGAVFNDAQTFRDTVFVGPADFSFVGFNGGALFEGSQFASKADFSDGSFADNTSFESARFADEALFVRCSFNHSRIRVGNQRFPVEVERRRTPPIADFTNTHFEQPNRVRFNRINQRKSADDELPPGFRVRFINCPIETVQFEDVRWQRKVGRMVLQDELDVLPHGGSWHEWYRVMKEDRYELVTIAYRRLVRNFDGSGSFDLAEDCYCGSLEMTRLDPVRPWFVRRLLNIYRWASFYGSDYERAFLVLLGLLVIFGISFAGLPVGLHESGTAQNLGSELAAGHRLLAGIFHSLEVATFERDTLYITANVLGKLISIGETILLPTQLALFLLAVRRRFRR